MDSVPAERVLVYDRIDANRRATRRLLVAFSLVLLLVAYLQFVLAARLVLRAARARPVGEEEEPELRRTMENLCIGSGLPQPALYVIESPAANALATGLEPERSAVAVTRGLLGLLAPAELEAV